MIMAIREHRTFWCVMKGADSIQGIQITPAVAQAIKVDPKHVGKTGPVVFVSKEAALSFLSQFSIRGDLFFVPEDHLESFVGELLASGVKTVFSCDGEMIEEVVVTE